MGEWIQRPNTDPTYLAICQFFLPPMGYLLLGQQDKAMLAALIFYVGGPLTCGALLFSQFVFSYDVFLLADKLHRGQPIGSHENAVAFLDNIFKDNLIERR